MGLGYKEVDDPSVMVRFPIAGQDASFLAWTTTPWTLPSNIALAVKADAKYATVEVDSEKVVLAEALLEKILGKKEYRVLETKPGSDWVGARYEPPFRYAKPEGDAHVVIAADFVELSTGSGMVHCAPAFGEDDFRACKTAGLGFLQLVSPDGTFPPEVYTTSRVDFAKRPTATSFETSGSETCSSMKKCTATNTHSAGGEWMIRSSNTHGQVGLYEPHRRSARSFKTTKR